MIVFTNIKINGGYIYATAKDLRTNKEVVVRAHKEDEHDIEVSNGECYGDFVRAVWYLQIQLADKGKLPEKIEVNWGM